MQISDAQFLSYNLTFSHSNSHSNSHDSLTNSRSRSRTMHDETSPLLENETAHQDVDSSGPTLREELQQTSKRGVVAVASVLLLVSISNFLSFAADPVILESIICRKYYDGLDERAAQPEKSCKVPQVQGEVAFINAWRGVSETLPGMLCASIVIANFHKSTRC